MNKKVIEFIRTKDYKFLEEIGQGGTGKTILIKDEIIDELFVCKKYSPIYAEQEPLYFGYFVEEIKILHKLHHKNLVRIFNYYLYPELTTGYILMEYIKGQDIKSFISKNPHLLSEVFVQTINGFSYLEQNNILHRDIRPANILVSDEGVVKIIDFGFGKKINFDDDFNKSISLNWRFSPPNDFKSKIYDFKTEIYFIGKLFEEIIKDNFLENFAYSNILNQMIRPEIDKRISKFAFVEREILNEENFEIYFSEEEKSTYRKFANGLQSIFTKIDENATYNNDIDKIILGLESAYRNSMLEEYIQNPNTVSRCFVNGAYYFGKPKIEITIIKDFIKLMNSLSIDKKKIILNNLWQRLDFIDRYNIDNDLPF